MSREGSSHEPAEHWIVIQPPKPSRQQLAVGGEESRHEAADPVTPLPTKSATLSLSTSIMPPNVSPLV
ncbi:hypothetical protein ACFXTH_045258 [Malus domestica]